MNENEIIIYEIHTCYTPDVCYNVYYENKEKNCDNCSLKYKDGFYVKPIILAKLITKKRNG